VKKGTAAIQTHGAKGFDFEFIKRPLSSIVEVPTYRIPNRKSTVRKDAYYNISQTSTAGKVITTLYNAKLQSLKTTYNRHSLHLKLNNTLYRLYLIHFPYKHLANIDKYLIEMFIHKNDSH